MTILKIIKDPDPLLRVKSNPVDVFDKNLKEFMQSLLETMQSESGFGIAAIQVGNPIRALIVDIPFNIGDRDNTTVEENKPWFIINPEITFISEEKAVLPEGCLSVRGSDGISVIRGDVERSKSISINYNDLDGNFKELTFNGDISKYELWSAKCLQHEIDHLNGILFIDKLYEPLENIDNILEIHDETNSRDEL